MADLTVVETPDAGAPIGAGSDRYLAFVLGGEVYAVDILDVTEIMEFRTLTVSTAPRRPMIMGVGAIGTRG